MKQNMEVADLRQTRNHLVEYIRRSNRQIIYEARRQPVYILSTLSQKKTSQEVNSQQKIRKQEKASDDFLQDQGPILSDSKKTKMYLHVLNLINMGPDIEIPKQTNKLTDEMIPLVFSLIRKQEYEERALCILIDNSNERRHYSLWVQNGAIQLFIQLLDSQNVKVALNAVCGIGCLASYQIGYRDIIFSLGAIEMICRLIEKLNHQKTPQQQHALDKCHEVLHMICDWPDLPQNQSAKQAIGQLLYATSQNLISDQIIFQKCLQTVAEHLKPQDTQLISRIRTLDNLIKNNADTQIKNKFKCSTQHLILTLLKSHCPNLKNMSLLPIITKLQSNLYLLNFQIHLTYFDQQLMYSIIASLPCGTQRQINELMGMETLIKTLINKFHFIERSNNQNQNVYLFFKNLIKHSRPSQLYRFYKKYLVVNKFYQVLSLSDGQTVKIALLLLNDILTFEESYRVGRSKPLASLFQFQSQWFPLDCLRNSDTANGRLLNKMINRSHNNNYDDEIAKEKSNNQTVYLIIED